jgi:hypothetical protein
VQFVFDLMDAASIAIITISSVIGAILIAIVLYYFLRPSPKPLTFDYRDTQEREYEKTVADIESWDKSDWSNTNFTTRIGQDNALLAT